MERLVEEYLIASKAVFGQLLQLTDPLRPVGGDPSCNEHVPIGKASGRPGVLQEEASRLEEKLMAHVLKYIGQVELIETRFVNLKDIIRLRRGTVSVAIDSVLFSGSFPRAHKRAALVERSR